MERNPGNKKNKKNKLGGEMITVNIFARLIDDSVEVKFLKDGTFDADECANSADKWPVWYQTQTNDYESLKLWFYLWLRRQFKLIASTDKGFMGIVDELLKGLMHEFNVDHSIVNDSNILNEGETGESE